MANFARFITVDFSQFDWLNRIDADVLLDVGDLLRIPDQGCH